MLSRLFHRRYLISLSYLLVVIIGVIAWKNIPLEMSPDLSLPSITVDYRWSRTSPEVMEKEVTRKVEQAANRLRDVRYIESNSRVFKDNISNMTFNGRIKLSFTKKKLKTSNVTTGVSNTLTY